MKNYMKHQRIVKPKSKLVKIAIAVGVISAVGISGIVGYVKGYVACMKDYNIKPSPVIEKIQDETIFDKRVRYLKIANEQLLHATTPEEINGLNLVMNDIENGVYDHSK